MYDINFFQERGELVLHVRRFLLFPKYWTQEDNQISTKLSWKSVKFQERKKDKIPRQSGIYCFVVKPCCKNFFETRYLFYVGKTNRTLRDRFGEYLRDQKNLAKARIKVYEMLNYYKDNLYFYYAELPSKDDVNLCEEKLLNTFVPHINTDIPKAKIKPELQRIYEIS